MTGEGGNCERLTLNVEVGKVEGGKLEDVPNLEVFALVCGRISPGIDCILPSMIVAVVKNVNGLIHC